MIAYEVATLRRVTRALGEGTEPDPARWISNVVVEALFPTIGLVVLIAMGMTRPYAALVAPVVLTYFLFISLSTLRLSPTLARLSGLCSAAGYSAVAIYVFARYPTPDLGTGMYPIEFYVGNIVIILVAGFVAGEVARQIRGHVSAALREAREVERIRGELETARTIQQGLLPKEAPRLAGYDVAGWNQPADQTGGDYFGWQDLPDGRVAFTLADVTGHGIGAALVAATCHAYTRAGMAEQSDLGAILGQLNRLLCDDLPPGKMVTFVAAALEPAEGRLELLSAGHGPLLLYTASDDRVQGFEAHGIPFGIFPTMPYGPTQKIRLAAGDLLVLLTDGFFEWENAAARGLRHPTAARGHPGRAQLAGLTDHLQPSRGRRPLCRRNEATGRPHGSGREAPRVRRGKLLNIALGEGVRLVSDPGAEQRVAHGEHDGTDENPDQTERE